MSFKGSPGSYPGPLWTLQRSERRKRNDNAYWHPDGRPTGTDPARLAAIAVFDDLFDRRGVKDVLECVDLDTFQEIVDTATELIRSNCLARAAAESRSTTPQE